MEVSKVILAKPRGFCAGVARAVEAVEKCLEIFGAPVYVKHEIVHNRTVVSALEAQGAVTVEHVSDVPEGAVCVFSAHGSKPGEYDEAQGRNLTLIDATCPLVTKVHLEARKFLERGFTVVYIGHRDHIEGEGVRAEAQVFGAEIPIVESVEDVEALTIDSEHIAYLTQTTLSVRETREIIEALRRKFPGITAPAREDICFATTNRQEAVTAIAEKSDLVLVIGSPASSNSNRLRETAEACGSAAYLIENADDICEEWFGDKVKTVGVTAGASASERVVEEVVEFFRSRGASVEEDMAVEENMTFSLPLELQKKLQEKG